MYQIGDWAFHHTFCFSHEGFDLQGFSKKLSSHDNSYKIMFIEDMQHSQPHMILYLEVIFLSWVGRILRKVKSLIMILLSAYTAYFSRPSSGELNRILCSSLTET